MQRRFIGVGMNELLYSALVGTVVGMAGTGLGALVSLGIRKSAKLPSILMNFSGGIMLSVVLFDLFPEAFRFGGVSVAVTGMILGAGFVAFLHRIVPFGNPDGRAPGADTRGRLMRTGVFIALGIAIHNFPEGLAIGSGLVSGSRYGLALALLIMLHDVPEGMAMSIPLRLGGVKSGACVAYAVLAGVPTALGALFGSLIGNIGASFIGGCMAFAGGAMLYITLIDLIPESRLLYRGGFALSLGAGLAAGALMVVFI